VQAGYVPPGLARGQLVDVYAVADPAAGAAATGGDVDRVLAAAPVQTVSGRGTGVLSTASTTVQVVVAVPRTSAADVLTAIGGRALVVAARSSVDAAADGGATASRPAPGTPAGPTG
jgi:hypothetical protein